MSTFRNESPFILNATVFGNFSFLTAPSMFDVFNYNWIISKGRVSESYVSAIFITTLRFLPSVSNL